MVRLTIEGVPVAKQRPRVTKYGTYTPARTREYEDKIRQIIVNHNINMYTQFTALHLSVHAYLQIPKSWSKRKQQQARDCEIYPTSRPDLDNFLKVIMDAGNKYLWYDDSQIVHAEITTSYSDDPYLELVVMTIDEYKNEQSFASQLP